MHYWIGTRFAIPENAVRTGPVSVGDQTKIKNKSPFKSNVQYMIYYIRPDKNGFVYHFKEEASGEDLYLTFPSTNDADKVIANALKEQLPDYSAFHNRFRG